MSLHVKRSPKPIMESRDRGDTSSITCDVANGTKVVREIQTVNKYVNDLTCAANRNARSQSQSRCISTSISCKMSVDSIESFAAAKCSARIRSTVALNSGTGCPD